MLHVCVCIHRHTIEYYSSMPFAATWIDLERIMVSEINQRKTDTE